MRWLTPAHHANARRRPRRTLAITLAAITAVLGGIGGLAWLVGGTAAQASPAATVSPYRPLTIPLVRSQVTLTARTARAAPALYTVTAGQSLSSISASQCGTPADWTGIYAASRAAHLTAWNANDLSAGQHLVIQCYSDPGMADRAPLPPPPPPAPVVQAAPVQQAVTPTSTAYPGYSSGSATASTGTYSAAPVSTAGDSSFESCVIARESGGNASAVNTSSGAGGLFQFLPSTWASLGYSGLPEDASVAEQQQAFDKLYAEEGASPWSDSDGC